MKKKLPVGLENFAEFFEQDFYYVDKTGFLIDLLKNWGKVNLFTRPRRFGKSLNMSMLKAFLEMGNKPELFEGLDISREKELCEKYLGKFPVISITLKDVNGLNYEAACASLREVIGREASRFSFLLKSDKLLPEELESYKALIEMDRGMYAMSDLNLESGMQTLSRLLNKHFGMKAIVLIDEYDVPLEKAYQAGYYEEMATLIRNMFSRVLKTNDNLYFAVLTGCLRISKESIFTGLNNLRVNSITDQAFAKFFGFTENEVQKLLTYYELENYSDTIQTWYDGYQFGDVAVYCPWDVISYCDALLTNRNAFPKNYWANSSGNAMVLSFINKADGTTKQEIEKLIAGDSIVKKINTELTYNELESSIENLWSVLFSTGYLTQREMLEDERYELAIPNKEIRSLFISQIQEWFKEATKENTEKLEQVCQAVISGNAEKVEELLNEYLWDGISIRESAVRDKYKENFYHGMLFGLLQYRSKWIMRSNEESGLGYSDLLIKTPERIGIVFEIKYADSVDDLEKECEEALKQIEDKKYDSRLKAEGMKEIIKYGAAFYLKSCKIIKA